MKTSIKYLVITTYIIVVALGLMLIIALNKNYSGKIKEFFREEKSSAIGLYKVKYVYDGDTIEVDISGVKEKVRLIGVDTPETQDPDLPVQCYGPESTAYTESRLLGKEVRMESDPTNQNRDRYDRLLRYVYLSDGTLWNKKLIEDGYGFAYLRYPFTKLKEFEATEKDAKNQKKGLWSACDPTIIDGVYRTNSAVSI